MYLNNPDYMAFERLLKTGVVLFCFLKEGQLV